MKQGLLIFIVLAVVGLTAACSVGSGQTESAQPQAAVSTFATQSNSEKAVTVEVTPLNLANGNATLDFEVTFNTHSVALDFDPAASSVLRDSTGREYLALAWEGDPPGGHHRQGTLRFTAPNQLTGFVEVVVQDVAGVPERVFRWNLPQ